MSVIYRALNKGKSPPQTEGENSPVATGLPPPPPSPTSDSPLQRHRKPMIMAGIALLLSLSGAGLVTLLAPKPVRTEQHSPPPPAAKPEIQSRPALARTPATSPALDASKGLPLPTPNRGGLTPPSPSMPPASMTQPPPAAPPAPAPLPILFPPPPGEESGAKEPAKEIVAKLPTDSFIVQPPEPPKREERKGEYRNPEAPRKNAVNVREAIANLKNAMASNDTFLVEKQFQELERAQGKDGIFLLKMRGFYAIQNGEYLHAERYLERILAIIPDDADANLNLAVVEAATRRTEQAESRLKNVIRLYPEDPRPRILLEKLH